MTQPETGAPVRPHTHPIVTRLDDLASSGRTGALQLSGELGGAIYFREGDVVYAKSKRTPGPAGWLAQPLAGRASSLESSLAIREATFDAALELLTDKPGYSPRLRFQQSAAPDAEVEGGISVAALLTEVTRRQRIMAQLATLVTADTEVTRRSEIASPSIRISAEQWALLIRAQGRCTPRILAGQLGRSVFTTTIEVSRLIALQLLTGTDAASSPAGQASDSPSGQRSPRVSFLRAVAR
jgi:Domain of unknown function (DUF4388)